MVRQFSKAVLKYVYRHVISIVVRKNGHRLKTYDYERFSNGSYDVWKIEIERYFSRNAERKKFKLYGLAAMNVNVFGTQRQ